MQKAGTYSWINSTICQNTNNSTGCPKKRGISECYSVWLAARLIWNLGYSFLIHLKIEIQIFVQSTKQFLSDIRELRNIYLIQLCVFITFISTIVNYCAILRLSQLYAYTFCQTPDLVRRTRS